MSAQVLLWEATCRNQPQASFEIKFLLLTHTHSPSAFHTYNRGVSLTVSCIRPTGHMLAMEMKPITLGCEIFN